jgi:hypothetical protein
MRIILDGKNDMPRKVGRSGPAEAYGASKPMVSKNLRPGDLQSLAEIAKRESLQTGYVARLTRLAFAAPRIVEAVAAGSQSGWPLFADADDEPRRTAAGVERTGTTTRHHIGQPQAPRAESLICN